MFRGRSFLRRTNLVIDGLHLSVSNDLLFDRRLVLVYPSKLSVRVLLIRLVVVLEFGESKTLLLVQLVRLW